MKQPVARSASQRRAGQRPLAIGTFFFIDRFTQRTVLHNSGLSARMVHRPTLWGTLRVAIISVPRLPARLPDTGVAG